MEKLKKCSKCGRELIAELKARGYTGELKYTQTISL
jgi:hypothetical protein